MPGTPDQKCTLLLINPPHYRYKTEKVPLDDFDNLFETVPPLGLLYIAAACSAENIPVTIFDMEAQRAPIQSLVNTLQKIQPHIVGITCPTILKSHVVSLFNLVKKVLPQCITVVGGPHCLNFPNDLLPIDTIDFHIIGEGEISLPQLIEHLFYQNGGLEDIPNLIWRDNKGRWTHNTIHRITNLDSLPFPDYHLLDISLYYNLFASKNPTVGIITSRGCPYFCSFCSPPFRTISKRSVHNVLLEIKKCVEKYSIKSFDFYDDTFNLDRKWVHQFCDAILADNLSISWRARCRPDLLDRETIRKMDQSGCNTVSLGIESCSDHVLTYYNKNYSRKHIENALDILKKTTIKIHGYFLIGAPVDTIESINRTIEFARSSPLHYASFYILNPLPGSPIYQNFIDEQHENFTITDIRGFRKALIPHPLFPPNTIQKLKTEAMIKFYRQPAVLLNCFTSFALLFIQSPGFRKNIWRLITSFLTRTLPPDGNSP